MVATVATAISNTMNSKSTPVSPSSLVVDAAMLRKVLRLVHCLQKERGASCAYKASCRPRTSSNNNNNNNNNDDGGGGRRGAKKQRKQLWFLSLSAAALKPARKDTDRAFEMLMQHSRSSDGKQTSIGNFAPIRATLEKLRKMLITPKESGVGDGPRTTTSIDTQQQPPPPKNQTTSASGFHRILVCYNALIQSIVHDYILKYTRQLHPILRLNSSSSSMHKNAGADVECRLNNGETTETLGKPAFTSDDVPSKVNCSTIPRNFSLQMLNQHALQQPSTPVTHHRRRRTLSQSKTSLLDSIQDFYNEQERKQSPQQRHQSHQSTESNHRSMNNNISSDQTSDVLIDETSGAPKVHPSSDPQQMYSLREFGGMVRRIPGGGFSLPPPPSVLPPSNPARPFLGQRMSTVSDTDAVDDYDYYDHHETSNDHHLHHSNAYAPFGHPDHRNSMNQHHSSNNDSREGGGGSDKNDALVLSSTADVLLGSDTNEDVDDSSSTSSSTSFEDVYIDSISDDNEKNDDDDIEDEQIKNLKHLVRLLKLLDSFVRLKEATGVQRAILSSLLAAGQIESRMLVTDLVLEVENHRHLLDQLKQQKFVSGMMSPSIDQIVDNVLHNLVQELVTMSPAMQQLQNAILQGFDLNALKDVFQNSPSQLWNLLTLYMDKLHSLELLIVEEIECSCDYFTHHNTVVSKNKNSNGLKPTLVVAAGENENGTSERNKANNGRTIDGSMSIITPQDKYHQPQDDKQVTQSSSELKEQHHQQQIKSTNTEKRGTDLIHLAFGISGTDPGQLQEILQKMSPEEMKQRLMDATKKQQQEPDQQQQSSSISEELTKTNRLADEAISKEQQEYESRLPQTQRLLQKQVQREQQQVQQQEYPPAASPFLNPELSTYDNNIQPDESNRSRDMTPAMKAVEDLLLEISQAPASKEWEIDLYEIQFRKRIGQGAAGTTYLADWCDLQVAVKVASINEMGLDGWRTEVQALQKLHHPNIIRLLGSVYHPNPLTFCLVLEYCDAGDLSSALLKATPRNFFLQVASGASRGMSYLHSRGIIHRDIKPGNILLHGNVASGLFQVKVTDFGVATDTASRANRTAETGTYRWMAPEVIRHENYSQTADVYSYAVVMWQLLTREEPFHDLGQIAAAAVVAIENKRPPFPEQTPTMIHQLIETCWSSEPTQRLPFDKITGELNRIEKELTEEELAWLQAPLGHWVYKKSKKNSNNKQNHDGGELHNHHQHAKKSVLMKRASWHSEGQPSSSSVNPAPSSLLLPSAKEYKKKGLKSLFSRK